MTQRQRKPSRLWRRQLTRVRSCSTKIKLKSIAKNRVRSGCSRRRRRPRSASPRARWSHLWKLHQRVENTLITQRQLRYLWRPRSASSQVLVPWLPSICLVQLLQEKTQHSWSRGILYLQSKKLCLRSPWKNHFAWKIKSLTKAPLNPRSS